MGWGGDGTDGIAMGWGRDGCNGGGVWMGIKCCPCADSNGSFPPAGQGRKIRYNELLPRPTVVLWVGRSAAFIAYVHLLNTMLVCAFVSYST